MRVKINGVLSEAELPVIINSDADQVGIFIGQRFASPFFILPSTAARLVRLLPPGIVPVMDTHVTDHQEIINLMERSGIYTVQLHCWETSEVIKLRDQLPHYAKIILSCFPASSNFKLDRLEASGRVADAVSLDCLNLEPGNNTARCGFPDWDAIAKIIHLFKGPWWFNNIPKTENAGAITKKFNVFGVEAGESFRNNGVLDAEQCREFVYLAKGIKFITTSITEHKTLMN